MSVCRPFLFFLLLLSTAVMHAQNYQIGDVITNENDGTKGVVFYVNPDGSGGWMVALNDAPGTAYKWSTRQEDVPGLDNLQMPANYTWTNLASFLSDVDGYDHTLKMRAAGGASQYPAAYAVDFENGWYLPTVGQMCLLYGMQGIIAQALTAAGGSLLQINAKYWSSNPATKSNAWRMSAKDGKYFSESKNLTTLTEFRVRAVRNFTAPQNVDDSISYLWSTGETDTCITVTPSQTTTYRVTATNASGHTATDEKIIHVNPRRTHTLYETACDSFVWNDVVYTEDGDYVQIFTASNGCDSIVTMHLTVHKSVTYDFYETACDSFVWYGTTYTESGDYARQLTTVAGCDSLLVLHLTIAHPVEMEISETACDQYVWGDTAITTSGDYTRRLTSEVDCDSVVNLHLTIINTALKLSLLPEDFCEKGEAELIAESEMTNYLWSTGETSPSIFINKPGFYSVTVSEAPCENTASLQVKSCPFTLYLPNAITPSNGDGLNDYLSIDEQTQSQIGEFKILIYNRWGQIIYQSSDKNFKWYGKVNDVLINNNVYVVQVFCTDLLGKEFIYNGTITVL